MVDHTIRRSFEDGKPAAHRKVEVDVLDFAVVALEQPVSHDRRIGPRIKKIAGLCVEQWCDDDRHEDPRNRVNRERGRGFQVRAAKWLIRRPRRRCVGRNLRLFESLAVKICAVKI
jgi:hypothetical protein